MQDFKVGGKITLDDKSSYRIVDLIEYDGKDYLFCCTNQKPIIPKIFERIKENERVFVREEDDPKIISKICVKVINKKS